MANAWLMRPGSSMIELQPYGFDEGPAHLQYPLFNYEASGRERARVGISIYLCRLCFLSARSRWFDGGCACSKARWDATLQGVDIRVLLLAQATFPVDHIPRPSFLRPSLPAGR